MNEQDRRNKMGTGDASLSGVEALEDVAALRREYEGQRLTPATSPEDPFVLFTQWFERAREICDEPSAMVLSTTTAEGIPSSRVVLLKGVDQRGFTFFTNYESRKVKEIETQPLAAINFFWPRLHQQIRLEGKVGRISPEASDRYFDSRPRESQLGAWASPQSAEIESRGVIALALEKRLAEFRGVEQIPRPPHWGGLRLEPNRFEFWQGQPSRLHDRILYLAIGSQEWSRARLAP